MSAMCDFTSPWKAKDMSGIPLKPSATEESVHKESFVFYNAVVFKPWVATLRWTARMI